MPKLQQERIIDSRRPVSRNEVFQIIGGGSAQYMLASERAGLMLKSDYDADADAVVDAANAVAIQDQPVAATIPTEGQILVYKSGVWTPVIWAPTGEPLVDDSGVTLLDDANDILSEG